MKREGGQHGMVRAYSVMLTQWDPRPNRNYPNKLTVPPTPSLFTKVSTKPTNHSKFTGKVKKGAHKIRLESHVGPDYRLVTRRVVDFSPDLKLCGLSSADILDYLARDEDADRDYNEDNDIEVEDLGSNNHEIGYVGQCDDDNNDDQMSYFEVGFDWQVVDADESWCLVEEM